MGDIPLSIWKDTHPLVLNAFKKLQGKVGNYKNVVIQNVRLRKKVEELKRIITEHNNQGQVSKGETA